MRNLWKLAVLMVISGCSSPGKTPKLSNAEVGRVIHEMTTLMVHDITSPPVAARFFSYACAAGYEIVVENDKKFSSLRGMVNGYPALKKPDSIQGYSYQVSAILSMIYTAEKLQPSGKLLSKYEERFIDTCKALGFSDDVLQQSRKYAAVVSKEILAYAKGDQYYRLSSKPRYTPLPGDGNWYPTPPAYLPAVEPYFNAVRAFFLDSCSQFAPIAPIPFSKDKRSDFYHLVLDNYQHSEDRLSKEQRDIALYWDCNPFAVQDNGHLMVGLKKISPGAHWMGIADIACRQTKQSFEQTLFIHTIVAMGLMDSFIACWDAKYRTNRVRPETAIRQLIDNQWMPVLQTPPFPEYLSGHSCVSGTSAEILSHFLGDNTSFVDTVETQYGLPARRFSSFTDAAKEAAISRFYGGIHFRDGVEEGMVQGIKVGKLIVSKVKS